MPLVFKLDNIENADDIQRKTCNHLTIKTVKIMLIAER